MMARSLFFALAMFAVGCGSGSQTSRSDVSLVSAYNLCACYRGNFNDSTYRDRRVQVYLKPREYRVGGGKIETHYSNPGRPACLVFETKEAPADDSCGLVVTGVCRGAVVDGRTREPGIDWFVLVSDCSVTILR